MSSNIDNSTPEPAEAAGPDLSSKKGAKKAAKYAANAAKKAAKSTKEALAPNTTATPKDKVEKKKEKKEEDVEHIQTPRGQKKHMSHEMASGYNPTHVEEAWYDWWQEQGYFKPHFKPDGSVKDAGIFMIPIPPPNVTGKLHIGHGLTIAIQDTLIRWNRMLGKTTLYVPGYDHAGISTQSVVERRLFKDTGKTRHDLGREKFLKVVGEWKDDYQARITSQLRRLGGSLDWDRVRFTLDENLSRAVIETFCRLHEDGTIYRSNRLVHWCVRLNTTLSNLEVDNKDLSGKTWLNVPGYDSNEKFEFGTLTSFKYPIENSDEAITVATTRPETMLGDTGIAVHPDDTRYTHLHGKFATHPFIPNRRIPIITDNILVDMKFGTSAVKITPAHDQNDYECGIRHKLEFINILNDDGTFNEHAGPFQGMKRFHARKEVVKQLKEKGLYVETKDNPMSIKLCTKSGDVVEPVLKPQWWVKCKDMADDAMKRTKAGELLISPKMFEGDWFRWMEDMQDWCISRQLWWGHRVPAYFVTIEGETGDATEGRNWVVGRNIEEATERATKLANGKKFTMEQDQDVLDTWFSSGLWPLSILGWPDKTADLEIFYPNSVLETGWDILFFWVARMVFFGNKFTGKMPFREVFLHAMIRDSHGRKMSKTLGNVVDPVDVIQGVKLEKLHEQLLEGNLDEREVAKATAGQKKDYPKGIPQCGTDALRFALCSYSTGGRDINLDVLRVEGYRKFCNKIWNATRFALLKLDASFQPLVSPKPTGNESLAERWILHKLNIAAGELNTHLAERNFLLATSALYNFWLYELCDVYIEVMKPMTEPTAPEHVRLSAQNTLYLCLDYGLRLLHPFMPFVTEELWQRLPRRRGVDPASIMMASYPLHDTSMVYGNEEKEFETVNKVIRTCRSMAVQYNLKNDFKVFIHSQDKAEASMLSGQTDTIVALSKGCQSAEVCEDSSKIPDGCASSVVSSSLAVHVLVKGVVDLDEEISRCDVRLAAAVKSLDALREVTGKEAYSKVPDSVRLADQEKMETYSSEIEVLKKSRATFASLK